LKLPKALLTNTNLYGLWNGFKLYRWRLFINIFLCTVGSCILRVSTALHSCRLMPLACFCVWLRLQFHLHPQPNLHSHSHPHPRHHPHPHPHLIPSHSRSLSDVGPNLWPGLPAGPFRIPKWQTATVKAGQKLQRQTATATAENCMALDRRLPPETGVV